MSQESLPIPSNSVLDMTLAERYETESEAEVSDIRDEYHSVLSMMASSKTFQFRDIDALTIDDFSNLLKESEGLAVDQTKNFNKLGLFPEDVMNDYLWYIAYKHASRQPHHSKINKMDEVEKNLLLAETEMRYTDIKWKAESLDFQL